MMRANEALKQITTKYEDATKELEATKKKMYALEHENKKLMQITQGVSQEAYDMLQQMNLQAHGKLMKLASEQFKMFDNFDFNVPVVHNIADTIDGAEGGARVGGAAVGGSAAGSDRGLKRSMPSPFEEVSTRSTRSSKVHVHQEVVLSQPFTQKNLNNAITCGVPALFDIDSINNAKSEIMEKLKDDKTLYRTTTNGTATFKQVYEDKQGIRRIEVGVHRPRWEYGSGKDIFHSLFPADTRMGKAWSSINNYCVNIPLEIMMVSGDSTKIQATIQDYGGVCISKTDQIVPCHYDAYHNFTMCLYGTKTVLLAQPDHVAEGDNHEKNLNRKVDCSSVIFRKAVLGPGQLLYIPMNWWHEVRTCTDAFSMAYNMLNYC
jgi:hypothetical protein